MASYLLSALSSESFIEYRNSENQSILGLVVTYGDARLAENLGVHIFPAGLDHDVTKQRFWDMVMVKDREGLNLIDICFLRRKTECAELFIGILKKLQETERANYENKEEKPEEISNNKWLQTYDFPALLKIETIPKWKCKDQIHQEKAIWERTQDLVTRYGGEWSEKDYRKMITAWYKKNSKIQLQEETAEVD